SSRRRHTRFSRDWSSDVCSSDLTMHEGIVPKGGGWAVLAALAGAAAAFGWLGREQAPLLGCLGLLALVSWRNDAVHVAVPVRLRSEERRGGKTCSEHV